MDNHGPSAIDHARIKLGIHSKVSPLILLDLVEYYTSEAEGELPYYPWGRHMFSVADLEAWHLYWGIYSLTCRFHPEILRQLN